MSTSISCESLCNYMEQRTLKNKVKNIDGQTDKNKEIFSEHGQRQGEEVRYNKNNQKSFQTHNKYLCIYIFLA